MPNLLPASIATDAINETQKYMRQRDELAKALNKYGSHIFGCAETSHELKPCNCGLHAALAKAREAASSPLGEKGKE